MKMEGRLHTLGSHNTTRNKTSDCGVQVIIGLSQVRRGVTEKHVRTTHGRYTYQYYPHEARMREGVGERIEPS